MVKLFYVRQSTANSKILNRTGTINDIYVHNITGKNRKIKFQGMLTKTRCHIKTVFAEGTFV